MRSPHSYHTIALTPPVSPYWPTVESGSPAFSVNPQIPRHFSFSEYDDDDMSELYAEAETVSSNGETTTLVSPPSSFWCERLLRVSSEDFDTSNPVSEDCVLSPLKDLSYYRGSQLSIASPPISIWHPTCSVTDSLFSETDHDISSYISSDRELLSSSCDGSYPQIPCEIVVTKQPKRIWYQLCRFPFRFFKKKRQSK